MDTLTRLIGERIQLARADSKLSQDALSKLVGFKDRQTLSTIELGQRQVSPEELMLFSEALDRPLDYFTDPYLVAGARALSYRAKEATPPELASFETQAGRLIAAHRRFQELLGRAPSPAQAQIGSLSERSPCDFATFMGERCAASWHLGEVPALRLREAAKAVGITVLHVDAPSTISGAACRLSDGAYVLINRNEPATRQNFDLGHEIFHLLTWDKLPPAKIDVIASEAPARTGTKGKRPAAEILADSFTAGLLMPSESVRARWSQDAGLPLDESILRGSGYFVVSPISYHWRLVNLGLLKKNAETARQVGNLRGSSGTEERPQLYSAEFVTDLHTVLERGAVTVRRALSLLDLEQDELEELFAAYKLAAPFDL